MTEILSTDIGLVVLSTVTFIGGPLALIWMITDTWRRR